MFTHALPDAIANPVEPAQPVTLADLPTDTRQSAEQHCRDQGLQTGAGLEGCVLDVGLTGDASLAANAASISTHLTGSVDAAALATADSTHTANLGAPTTGSLATALAPVVYTAALQAHTAADISVADCPAGGSFQITLIAPDGQPVDRTAGAGCGTLHVADLPSSGVYQLKVLDPGGFTGAFHFTLTGTAFALAGHLDLSGGDGDKWTFTTTAGQRVFVDTTAGYTLDGGGSPATLAAGTHTLTFSGAYTAKLWDVRDQPPVTFSFPDFTSLTGVEPGRQRAAGRRPRSPHRRGRQPGRRTLGRQDRSTRAATGRPATPPICTTARAPTASRSCSPTPKPGPDRRRAAEASAISA